MGPQCPGVPDSLYVPWLYYALQEKNLTHEKKSMCFNNQKKTRKGGIGIVWQQDQQARLHNTYVNDKLFHVYLRDLTAYPTGQINMTTIRQSAVYYSHIKVYNCFLQQTLFKLSEKKGNVNVDILWKRK